MTKTCTLSNKEIEFLIWDTAGQEYYDSITKRYYKGANAAVLVFSVENKDSFNNISKWKDKVIAECGRIPMIIVMNKIDLEDHLISLKEAEDLCEKLSLCLIMASVKQDKNIKTIFEFLAIEVIKAFTSADKLDIDKLNQEENTRQQNSLSIKNLKPDGKGGFKLADQQKSKKRKCC